MNINTPRQYPFSFNTTIDQCRLLECFTSSFRDNLTLCTGPSLFVNCTDMIQINQRYAFILPVVLARSAP